MRQMVGISLFMLICCMAAVSFAQQEPKSMIRAGQPWPNISLTAPQNTDESSYLGLANSIKTFKISDVRASFVLVEIFNSF